MVSFVSKLRETKPCWKASLASIFRPDNASSRIRLLNNCTESKKTSDKIRNSAYTVYSAWVYESSNNSSSNTSMPAMLQLLIQNPPNSNQNTNLDGNHKKLPKQVQASGCQLSLVAAVIPQHQMRDQCLPPPIEKLHPLYRNGCRKQIPTQVQLPKQHHAYRQSQPSHKSPDAQVLEHLKSLKCKRFSFLGVAVLLSLKTKARHKKKTEKNAMWTSKLR